MCWDMGYDKDTGLPTDKSYLECGLPPFLVDSIDAVKKMWELFDRGIRTYREDLYYDELNADINSAEVNGVISSEQAWYLRKKYLRVTRGWD